jgi:hypothetical protein
MEKLKNIKFIFRYISFNFTIKIDSQLTNIFFQKTMQTTYYISNAPSGEGFVLLTGLLLFDNYYSKEVLEGRARLYAVFDDLETPTRATSNFVLCHNGETHPLIWTDAKPTDVAHVPIPLTFIRQTTDALVSELMNSIIEEEQSIHRIEVLAQAAVEELHKINQPLKVQKRIADLIIKDAIQQELTCSITMNPLTLQSATCVAPCYHVFDKEAITKWLATKDTCPECREKCSL